MMRWLTFLCLASVAAAIDLPPRLTGTGNRVGTPDPRHRIEVVTEVVAIRDILLATAVQHPDMEALQQMIATADISVLLELIGTRAEVAVFLLDPVRWCVLHPEIQGAASGQWLVANGQEVTLGQWLVANIAQPPSLVLLSSAAPAMDVDRWLTTREVINITGIYPGNWLAHAVANLRKRIAAEGFSDAVMTDFAKIKATLAAPVPKSEGRDNEAR